MVIHFMKAGVVPAAVTFEARGGFERMDHESEAGTGGEEG